MSTEDGIAHCESPGCGIVFRPPRSARDRAHQALYEQAHPAIHREESPARRVLTKAGIHPAVIAHSRVGECPPDWDEAPYFMADIAALEAEMAAAQVKQPGRPKKQEGPTPEERLAALRQQQADLRKALEGRGGWLMYFYTDASGSISGFEMVNHV